MNLRSHLSSVQVRKHGFLPMEIAFFTVQFGNHSIQCIVFYPKKVLQNLLLRIPMINLLVAATEAPVQGP